MWRVSLRYPVAEGLVSPIPGFDLMIDIALPWPSGLEKPPYFLKCPVKGLISHNGSRAGCGG